MANVGYIRVSTTDQHTDRQLAGVQLDKVFTDKVSGKGTDRPGLQAMLEYVRIPLYSITDWHRSPISDSHPFDQPGT
ncbi:hypothetical protein ABL75_004703 [Salmonella enterica subsp. enterica]|nr:hypothetical protein [Salmonella enterica subsp. enterica]